MFNNDNYIFRPHTSTRAKSRTKPRTPYVQSAPQVTHLKRPRSRRQMLTPASTMASNDESNHRPATASFYMFLSLPNTPDTEMMKNSTKSKPIPGTESYIWEINLEMFFLYETLPFMVKIHGKWFHNIIQKSILC